MDYSRETTVGYIPFLLTSLWNVDLDCNHKKMPRSAKTAEAPANKNPEKDGVDLKILVKVQDY